MKSRLWNRILAMLMSVMLAAGLIPVTMYAADGSGNAAAVTVEGQTTEYADFEEALAAADGKDAVVTLLQDTQTVNTEVWIHTGNIILDGNGFQLTIADCIGVDGILTLRNVNIPGNALIVQGGHVVMESGYCANINIFANGSSMDAQITLNGGNVDSIWMPQGTLTNNGAQVQTLSLLGGSAYYNGGHIETIEQKEGVVYRSTPIPEVSVEAVSASSITIMPPLDAEVYGGASYKLEKDGSVIADWQDSSVFRNLSAGTAYTVYVKYKGTDVIPASEPAKIEGTTLQQQSTVIIPDRVRAHDERFETDSSGANLYIDPAKPFDLGYNGKIVVYSNLAGSTVTLSGEKASVSAHMYIADVNGTRQQAQTDAAHVLAILDGTEDAFKICVSINETSEALPAGTYQGEAVIYTGYTEGEAAYGEAAGVDLSALTKYTIPVVYDLTAHSVTLEAEGKGSVSQSIDSAVLNETVSIKAVPDKGHYLKEWQVVSGNVSIADPKQKETTFCMSSEEVIIKAVFAAYTYGDPVWTWSDDYKTATVSFKSSDGADTQTLEAEVKSEKTKEPTCTKKGETTYTAAVAFNGKTYTDTKTVADIEMTEHTYKEGKCTVCKKPDPDFTVKITAGAKSIWTKGSKIGLSFTSNAAYSDFEKVQIDGKDLKTVYYSVKKGSTIVTLNAPYLEALSVGKHTITIVSDTGKAKTEFTVKAADQDDNKSAKTGDNSDVAVWIGLMLAAGIVLLGAAAAIRKRRK